MKGEEGGGERQAGVCGEGSEREEGSSGQRRKEESGEGGKQAREEEMAGEGRTAEGSCGRRATTSPDRATRSVVESTRTVLYK